MSRVIELFAGSGGMSQGMAMLGIPSIGVEFHEGAVATALAAGHERIHSDVTDLEPASFGPIWGFHASPPCQAWSRAGQQKGQLDKPNVLALLDAYAHGNPVKHTDLEWHDQRSHLAAEPMRWIFALRPEWITMEETREALPIWERYAEHLERLGYSVWTGKLWSEQYGVAQTRERAILIANRTFEVAAPKPTHRKWKKGVPQSEGDPELRPWMSMVDALGWGMTGRPSMVVTGGGTGSGGGAEPFGSEARQTMYAAQENGAWGPKDRVGFGRKGDDLGPQTEDGYRERDFRTADQPAFAVTGKIRAHLRHGPNAKATVRSEDEPAATVFFGNDPAAFRWHFDQPAQVHEHFGDGGCVCGVAWTEEHGRLAASDLPIEYREHVVSMAGGVAGESRPRDPFTEPHATLTGAGSSFWTIPEEKLAIQTPEYVIDRAWPHDRPSTAVAGRGLVQHPGATANRFNGSVKSRNDGVRISVGEAALLQSMPHDYPWQGSKTQQYQRIGDLVPARLAANVVGAALGVSDYVDYIDRHYDAGQPWGTP